MYKGKTIAVVVPAYNEEAHVGEVITTVPSFVDRTYVVDDRSTDATWAEIRRYAREVNERAALEPRQIEVQPGRTTSEAGQPRRIVEDGGAELRVVPLRHERNQGVGAAIKTGYRRARADGHEVAAVFNGDGQMDPARLGELLDPVVDGRVKYAKGNRLLTPEHRAGMPPLRLVGNTLLTYLTRVASGYWGMSDPQNGYTAISLDVFDEIEMDGLYDQYGFLNDLLVRLNAHGMPITDVPMPARYGDEKSSIKYRTFVPNVSLLLVRDLLWRLHVKYVRRQFHPVVLCYLLGALGFVGGGLLLGSSVLGGEFGGVGPSMAGGLAAVGALLVVVALAVDRHLNRGLFSRSELLAVEG